MTGSFPLHILLSNDGDSSFGIQIAELLNRHWADINKAVESNSINTDLNLCNI